MPIIRRTVGYKLYQKDEKRDTGNQREMRMLSIRK